MFSGSSELFSLEISGTLAGCLGFVPFPRLLHCTVSVARTLSYVLSSIVCSASSVGSVTSRLARGAIESSLAPKSTSLNGM